MASGSKEEKARELIQKSMEDMNNALRDVEALNTLFQHSQYAILSEIKANLDNAKLRIQEMAHQIQYLRIQNIIGYGIWYSDSVSSYPASSRFNIQTYYKTPNEAKAVALRLAKENPKLTFMVYPYNGDYSIAGKAVAKLNAI